MTVDITELDDQIDFFADEDDYLVTADEILSQFETLPDAVRPFYAYLHNGITALASALAELPGAGKDPDSQISECQEAAEEMADEAEAFRRNDMSREETDELIDRTTNIIYGEEDDEIRMDLQIVIETLVNSLVVIALDYEGSEAVLADLKARVNELKVSEAEKDAGRRLIDDAAAFLNSVQIEDDEDLWEDE